MEEISDLPVKVWRTVFLNKLNLCTSYFFYAHIFNFCCCWLINNIKGKETSKTLSLLWKVWTRSHFKSRLSLIVRVYVVLNRTVVVDSDWRFDNLCGSHLQSQSELYHVSWWYYTLLIDLIGQLRCDIMGRLSVKPWCYWLWRLVISNRCVSIRLFSQLNSRLLLVKLSFSRS